MESLFNQAVSFSIFGAILAVSGTMVWLRNNHNAFKEVLTRVESFKLFNNESSKVQKQLMEDVIYLRSQVLKLKSEIDQVQDYNAKIKDQMQILSRRQKYLKEKMIPQKVIIEASSELSKQYAKHFSTIKKQLKDF